MEQGSD